MRLAVFSDVHGNLPALQAVLRHIEAQGSVDLLVCLGDLSYKGPFPAECIRTICDLGIPTVHGNTDHYLLALTDHEVDCPSTRNINIVPEEVPYLRWHLARLDEDDVEFLAKLPFEHRLRSDGLTVQFVHATPMDCLAAIRPHDSPELISDRLCGTDADWIVMGHIHRPFVRRHNGKLLINVGAVGYSLDRDWRASYAVLDTESGDASHHRVEFDIDRCVAAAVERKFCYSPTWYGEALRKGWWEPIPYAERRRTDGFA